jgi:hypothetical protein
MKTSPGIGFGVSLLLFILSAIPGIAVAVFLTISLGPLVDLFPVTSNAQDIALAVSTMWGLVVAATVAVYAFGSVRRARRAAEDTGAETDWEVQRRYVPLAGRRLGRAEAYPVHAGSEYSGAEYRDMEDEDYGAAAALEHRLRRMEAMMASNTRPAGHARAPSRPVAAPPPLTGANLRPSNNGSGASPRHAAPSQYYDQPRRRAQR